MLRWIGSHIHPLWHLRRNSSAFRWVTRNIRIPWLVHSRRIKHGVYVDVLRNPGLVASVDSYEAQDIDLIMDLAKNFGLKKFFDVGGNVGLYSFAFAGVGPGAQVVTFEPDKINYDLLR